MFFRRGCLIIFVGLYELNIAENQLAVLPEGIFDNLRGLYELNIAGNRLTTLPEGIFGNLYHLQRLHLQNNRLEMVSSQTFNSAHNLRYLDLGRNSLIYIPTGIFSKQNNLKELYLDDNQLSWLPTDIFSDLDSLWSLDISGNQLEIPLKNIIDNLKSILQLNFYNDLGDAGSITYSQDIFSDALDEIRNDMPPNLYVYHILFLHNGILSENIRTELLRLYHDILSRTGPEYYIYIYAFNSRQEISMMLRHEHEERTRASKHTRENGIVVLSEIAHHRLYNNGANALLVKNPDKDSSEIIFHPKQRFLQWHPNRSVLINYYSISN